MIVRLTEATRRLSPHGLHLHRVMASIALDRTPAVESAKADASSAIASVATAAPNAPATAMTATATIAAASTGAAAEVVPSAGLPYPADAFSLSDAVCTYTAITPAPTSYRGASTKPAPETEGPRSMNDQDDVTPKGHKHMMGDHALSRTASVQRPILRQSIAMLKRPGVNPNTAAHSGAG